jgi:hypothetical protein
MQLKAILWALIFSVSGTAIAGSWSGYRLGNSDYWDSTQGDHYSGYQLGNSYYWSGTDRYGRYHSGSGYRLGNSTYWDDEQ